MDAVPKHAPLPPPRRGDLPLPRLPEVSENRGGPVTDVLVDAPKPGQGALVPVASTALVPVQRGSWGARIVGGVVGAIGYLADRFAASVAGTLAAIADLGQPAWKTYRAPSLELPAALPKARLTAVDDVKPSLRGMAFHSDHDLFYDGHFTIPGRLDACVTLEQLLEKPNWVEIIQADLTHGDTKPGDPLRVFIPGLNTPVKDSVERVALYAKFTGMPMAQLQNGATTDFGDLNLPFCAGTVKVPGALRDWIQAVVQVLDLRPSEAAQALGSNELALALGQIERGNIGLIDRLQKLLIAYVDHDDPPPLELMPYSEATVVLKYALNTLEARYLQGKLSQVPEAARAQRAEELGERFRERLARVTILTIGSGARSYPTEAKVVHLYGWGKNKDRVVQFLGPLRAHGVVRAIADVGGGRRDALLPFEHPFPGFDAHNFVATGSHALALYLEKNGARTSRDLWERYEAGALTTPTLEEVTARIQKNGGEKYRWYRGPLGWGGL